MTSGLRWRIFVLQVGLIGILAFVSGFAFWASNFATSTVHDQLAAQQIYFPAAGSTAITSLPKVDAAAVSQYAGQELLTGAQAQVYANNFINVHLSEIANGQTYSQLSTAAQADPTNTKLAGEVATIFKGTTSRQHAAECLRLVRDRHVRRLRRHRPADRSGGGPRRLLLRDRQLAPVGEGGTDNPRNSAGEAGSGHRVGTTSGRRSRCGQRIHQPAAGGSFFVLRLTAVVASGGHEYVRLRPAKRPSR